MKPGSAIVMTGSVTGIEGNKHLLDYSMTKGRHPRLHAVAFGKSDRGEEDVSWRDLFRLRGALNGGLLADLRDLVGRAGPLD